MADLVALEKAIWEDKAELKKWLLAYYRSVVKYANTESLYLGALKESMEELENANYSVTNLKEKARAMCAKEKKDMELAFGQRRYADMQVDSLKSSISAVQSLLSIERAKIEKGLYGEGA